MPGSALFVGAPELPNHNSSDNKQLTLEEIPNLKEEQMRQIPQENET